MLAVPLTVSLLVAAPFGGLPLKGTGLRLAVAADPPVAVDVDTAAVRPIRVPGEPDGRPASLVRVGPAAVLVGVVRCDGCGDNRAVFVVRPDAMTAVPLGRWRAWGVAAARGRGVWLLGLDQATRRCTLRRVGLDGRTLSPERAARCGDATGGTYAPGLIFDRGPDTLVDPVTGRVLLAARRIAAATGEAAVTADEGRGLAVRDLRSGVVRWVPWPSRLPLLQVAAVHPDGRRVALAFMQAPLAQELDVWVLDTVTGRLEHVPGLPVAAGIKGTGLAWTGDGRLAVLTSVRERDALLVWRPGERRARTGWLDLPPRYGIGGLVAWGR